LLALDINNDTIRCTLQGLRVDCEYVIPRAGSCPHLVVLEEVWINKSPELGRQAERRHAVIGLGNSIV
jgi:hypothetical protein